LSFKIILIQKSQISIFRKGLNLFEFKNVFDLDLNLGFKFKSAAKIFEKHFSFSLGSPKLLSAQSAMQPASFPLPIPRRPSKGLAFLIDPVSPDDVAHLAQLAHTSFVFHLRSASCRRRSASRRHAHSPLATSGAWESSHHDASSSSPPTTYATPSLLIAKPKL
jgi:hypothetical protein